MYSATDSGSFGQCNCQYIELNYYSITLDMNRSDESVRMNQFGLCDLSHNTFVVISNINRQTKLDLAQGTPADSQSRKVRISS